MHVPIPTQSPPTRSALAALNLIGIVLVFWVLPPFGAAVLLPACALIVTTQVAWAPDLFRSRSGSFKPIFWLLGWMWAIAVGAIVVKLFRLI